MINKIGGLRAGIKNVTWPFARLKLQNGELQITSIMGSYRFNKSEILALSRYELIPFIGQGIRISHNKEKYPSFIVFWYFGDLNKLIKEIQIYLNEAN